MLKAKESVGTWAMAGIIHRVICPAAQALKMTGIPVNTWKLHEQFVYDMS